MSGAPGGPIVAPPAAPATPLARPPSFSVVIPAYQAAATIGETVESVLAQTVRPLELIVSDDGSTDGLEDALAPHREALRLIRRPHGGIAAARNAGVEAASGDFVLFVDADDLLLPRKLEALTELAVARPDLDLLSTDVFFERDGQRVGRFGEANPFAASDQRAAIVGSCFVGWPAARRTRLVEVGGFDTELPSAVDWDCWLRLIFAGSAAGLYDEPLSVYRVHGGSVSARRAGSLRARTRMLEKAITRSGTGARERVLLQRAIDSTRGRATLAEAEEALRDAGPHRRRRALAAARARGLPVRTRAAAVAAAAAPGMARAWLRRSSRRPPLERRLPGDESA
jgi:GT2 family glycosyltransferase